MRSSNPTLQPETFQKLGTAAQGEAMTIQGVINKTGLLLLCVLITAGWTWMQFFQSGGNAAAVQTWMWVGLLGGLGLAIATVIKKEWAPVTAPLYALAEGLFIGGISSIFEASYPGIVVQATSLTFGTMFAMLIAYRTGWVKATEGFKLGVIAATGGIAIVYFIAIILNMFFGVSLSFIYGNGALGIGFSLFVVVIAALNFVLDFDLIEKGTQYRLPKYMEWYCSFALMVTLIWLYIEFLRLLSKARSR